MNDTDKLDLIIEDLAAIKALVMTPKRLRNNLKALAPNEIVDRTGDMKRVFNMAASMSKEKKSQQNFPKDTYSLDNRRVEIMPRSILVNRCSLRKAFRPDEKELGKKTTIDVVNETLDDLIKRGYFYEARLVDAIPKSRSFALCIFSKKEAAKYGMCEIEKEDPFADFVDDEPEPDPTGTKNVNPNYRPLPPREEMEKKAAPAQWSPDMIPKKPAASPMQWSPDLMKKPAAGDPDAKEEAERKEREQDMIRHMQALDQKDLLDDDDEIFQVETEKKDKKKKKIEL